MLLESVSKGSSDESALIRVMAWRRIGDNQDPKMTENIVFDLYLNVWRFYLGHIRFLSKLAIHIKYAYLIYTVWQQKVPLWLLS